MPAPLSLDFDGEQVSLGIAVGQRDGGAVDLFAVGLPVGVCRGEHSGACAGTVAVVARVFSVDEIHARLRPATPSQAQEPDAQVERRSKLLLLPARPTRASENVLF